MPDSRSPRLRAVLAFVAAVLTTTVVGSVLQTQINLAAVQALGAQIGPSLRLRTTWDDLLGFAPAWAGIVAAGFLLALPVAAWLGRRWPAWRPALSVLAGAFAIAVALWLMRLALGLNAVAAARSGSGLLLLALAGALGGWVFARLSRRPRHRWSTRSGVA
jgi:peptidoglycan/LPS O-acetylase OafA/YrhL